MNKQEKDLKSLVESADSWVDELVEVCGGHQLNPYYMDGMVTDRRGADMSKERQVALQNYRHIQREQWRKNNNNITGEKV